jgi:hypothetical protein
VAAFWNAIERLLAWLFASSLSSWSSPQTLEAGHRPEAMMAREAMILGNAQKVIFG